MNIRWRFYFRMLAIGIGLLFGGALILNLFANPLRLTPSILSFDSLDPYREIAGQMRAAKAGIIRSDGDWQVMLAGSSRVGHGFDPKAEVWAGKRVVNLGLSGGFIYETDAMVRYALDRCRPECVVVGIDPTDLSTDFDSRGSADYWTSPLADGEGKLEREMSYLCGISTAELSLKVLKRCLTGDLSRYSAEGFRMRSDKDEKEDQLEFVRRHLIDTPPYAPSPVRKEKEQVLESLVERAKRSGCRVVLLYFPMHAVTYADMRDEASGVIPFEAERRSLCGLAGRTGAEFWDFNIFHPIQCDPLPEESHQLMPHWNDLGHFTSSVGEKMITELLANDEADRSGFGVRVLPAGLEAHLAAVGEAYRAYLTGAGKTDLRRKYEWLAE